MKSAQQPPRALTCVLISAMAASVSAVSLDVDLEVQCSASGVVLPFQVNSFKAAIVSVGFAIFALLMVAFGLYSCCRARHGDRAPQGAVAPRPDDLALARGDTPRAPGLVLTFLGYDVVLTGLWLGRQPARA